MEIRHIQSFVAAAEAQSFTKAAELVGLTQSAVSQHVGLLEKELGRGLFERKANSVTLTQFGEVIYHHARKIQSIVEEIKQEAGQKSTEVAGLVTIASSTVPSEWLLPELLLLIRATYSQIQESVTVSDSAQAIDAVESGQVDFALVGELPRATNLCAKRVAEDELVLVVSPHHPLANSKTIDPKQLVEHSLIFRESGSGSRRCIENALSTVGVFLSDLTISMEVNSNDAIRAAVERGVGISFLSHKAIEREIEDGRLTKVDITGLKMIRSLYLVTDPRRLPNRIVRAVLDLTDIYRQGSIEQV